MSALKKRQIVDVLDTMSRDGLKWVPGEDKNHLQKRIKLGHLQHGSTMTDYNQIILSMLKTESEVFIHYMHDDCFVIGDYKWIVVIKTNGLIITSFPPDDYEAYINEEKGYEYIGTIEEVRNYVKQLSS